MTRGKGSHLYNSQIKDLGQALLDKIESVGSSRELYLARTKTEEAVMWAVKHITA